MRVAILGTGEVGRSLGTGFLGLGDEVMMGSRDAGNEKAKAWVAGAGARASAGTFAEAAEFGELAVLATLWSGTGAALSLAGANRLARKVVVDATNPLVFEEGKPPRLAIGHLDSGGEQVQGWLPSSKVVKAFNIVGHAHMVNPKFPDGPPTMFFCGNDAEAKKRVAEILAAFGWESTDIGGIEGARLLEPMCILWVLYGLQTSSWNHAFRMLRK